MTDIALSQLSDEEFDQLQQEVGMEHIRRMQEKYRQKHPKDSPNPLKGLLSEYTDRTDLSSLLIRQPHPHA